MKKIIIYAIALILITSVEKIMAQGCVAIRSNGGYCTMAKHIDSSKWQLSINNRYFKSYKHFVGTVEQTQRQTLGTEVINHQFTTDLALTHKLDNRWSIMLDLPIESNSRSDLYEHNNVGRYVTHSFGVGDIRLAVYAWLLNPDKMPKGNIQLGLGLKLPTGAYDYQDFFHITKDSLRLGPVDQSIQLGDGGTGITFEFNGFYNFSHSISAYGNFYYLSNPRDVNGTLTTRGGAISASSINNGSYVMSVPDQSMARAGVNINAKNFMFSAGARYECLPVHDLIGGSDGFRRPGNILSVEPGVTYNFNKISVYLYAPIAVRRDRPQSVADQITSKLTGTFANGDAAFADYALNLGAVFKF